MKRFKIVCAAALVFAGIAGAVSEKQIDDILGKMTIEEKVSLCHGVTDFTTASVERLGIRSLRFSDGPHGVRQDGKDQTYFPTCISIGSTWNRELAEKMGHALGAETRGSGIDVILGPAICIDRNPLCGRFFEYVSEDPYLAGEIAAGYITGVQGAGAAACAKHYAVNSQEIERGSISEVVQERTLHEIYFPAFKKAVESGVFTVMCAYNKVNGTWCAENPYLLTKVMKEDWGFDGVIMSDWGAVHSTIPTAYAGLDLEMPGNDHNYLGKPLLDAVKKGEVPESIINDKARRMIKLVLTLDEIKAAKFDKKANEQVALDTARESIVLMKNEGSVLPLDKSKAKKIFVTGINADHKHGPSGGSSAVYSSYEITPLAGLKEACGDKISLVYRPTAMSEALVPVPAANLWTDKDKTAHGLKASFYTNREFTGEPELTRVDGQVNFTWKGGAPFDGFRTDSFAVRWEGFLTAGESGQYVLGVSSDDGSRLYLNDEPVSEGWYDHGEMLFKATVNLEKDMVNKIRVEFFENAGDATCKLLWAPLQDRNKLLEENAKLAAGCDAAIIFAGIDHSYDSEGNDKPDMLLTNNQQLEINAIAKQNPNTVVVLINGSPVEMGDFIGNVPALIEAWYPGQLGGRALAEIIFGDVNPSGKLPVTLPKLLADTPAIKLGEYPGKDGSVKHNEEIYVGYRYYDTKNIEPEFAFGHGLSYTDFAYEGISVTTNSPFTATVKVTVRNVGKVAGKETVQLYVTDEKCSLDRPEKELKGFEKVSLKPNEAKTVTFELGKDAFSFYNQKTHSWEAENGSFNILTGSSSKDIRCNASLSFSVN